MFNRVLWTVLLMVGLISWAIAGSSTLVVKDGNGTLQNMGVTTDVSGNLYSNQVIVDGTAAANKAAVTSSNALKVDGSAVTQPVSGTLTLGAGSATIGALSLHQSTNVDQIGGAAVALGQTTMAGSLPVAIASNQGNVPINNAQVSGTAISVNSGTKDAGTQRVVLATDQPTLTNPINTGTHTATQNLYAPGTNGFTTTPFNVLTTELNALASAAVATSSVAGPFTQTTTGNAIFGRCWVKLGAALGGTAVSGANFSIWYLTSTDGGTTFESQTVSPPPRAPDVIIPVGASNYGANAVLMSPPRQWLWAESVKIVFQNNTGQAMGASGNIMTCGPESIQN